jgi:hypothetical protein
MHNFLFYTGVYKLHAHHEEAPRCDDIQCFLKSVTKTTYDDAHAMTQR